MKNNKVIVCAIDLLILLLSICILTIFSIKYDKDKGLGDKNFVKLDNLISENFTNDTYSSVEYYPIIIYSDRVTLNKYIHGTCSEIVKISNKDDFDKLIKNKEFVYVIYENEKNIFFEHLVKFMLKNDIQVFVAKIYNDNN